MNTAVDYNEVIYDTENSSDNSAEVKKKKIGLGLKKKIENLRLK